MRACVRACVCVCVCLCLCVCVFCVCVCARARLTDSSRKGLTQCIFCRNILVGRRGVCVWGGVTGECKRVMNILVGGGGGGAFSSRENNN